MYHSKTNSDDLKSFKIITLIIYNLLLPYPNTTKFSFLNIHKISSPK